MTRMNFDRFLGLATAAVLLLVGCSGAEHAADDSPSFAVEEGHEGHNHGPGEHGLSAALVRHDAETADWCYEHAVPESACTQCNPDLIEQFKASGDWCVGHGLPESHCRICNPGLRFAQEDAVRAHATEGVSGDISVSLFFRPNAAVCATNDALIQFASAETADRAGLSIHRVRSAAGEAVIEAPAEVVFDETASTVVTSTVPAMVSQWLVSPGGVVTEDDVIALMVSPEIAQFEADLISAYAANEVQQKEVARHKELKAGELISDSDYDREVALGEKTNAEYICARGLLLAAGLNDDDLQEIISHKKVSNRFPLRAPADGVVVERRAQLGVLLEAGQALAMLADPAAMWIEARLAEEQLRRVNLDQMLTFSSDGRGLGQVGGRIVWVSRLLDPHTRTGVVRAEVIDPAHRLRAGEFGRVKIIERGQRQVTLVPKDAVQWEGCCNVVFVREAVDRYRPRKVEFYDGDGPFYQVTEGLREGEEVVVSGAFLLKTELKKSSIGAGCCGLDPVG